MRCRPTTTPPPTRTRRPSARCSPSATIEEIEATGSDCPTTFEEVGFGSVPDDFEIGEVTEEGDTATVEATADGTTEDVPLIDEDGEWKLDFAAVTPDVPSEEPTTTTAPEESDQP